MGAGFAILKPTKTGPDFYPRGLNPSEKFGRSVAIPGDSVVELGSNRPESPGIAKWDFSASGGD